MSFDVLHPDGVRAYKGWESEGSQKGPSRTGTHTKVGGRHQHRNSSPPFACHSAACSSGPDLTSTFNAPGLRTPALQFRLHQTAIDGMDI